MNLAFFVNGGAGVVEFPFQTPTSLTYAVLKKETNEERLVLIKQYLEGEPPEYVEDILEQIQQLMSSPHLTLGMM